MSQNSLGFNQKVSGLLPNIKGWKSYNPMWPKLSLLLTGIKCHYRWLVLPNPTTDACLQGLELHAYTVSVQFTLLTLAQKSNSFCFHSLSFFLIIVSKAQFTGPLLLGLEKLARLGRYHAETTHPSLLNPEQQKQKYQALLLSLNHQSKSPLTVILFLVFSCPFLHTQ